jgi:DNA mismatch repair protein MutS2
MITSIEHSKIELTDKKERQKTKNRSSISNYDERRLNFKSEIDVRGMRGEEAITKVQDYIDDALVVGINKVRIIHGKGNGILRQLIRQYLNSSNIVKSLNDEHPDRGGSGLTIVELDV